MQIEPTREDLEALELYLRLASCPESYDMKKDFGALAHWLNLSSNKFVDRLKMKYPQLERNDLCLCCLLRLGYSLEVISTVKGTKPESVRRAIHRLCKQISNLSLSVEWFIIFIRRF